MRRHLRQLRGKQCRKTTRRRAAAVYKQCYRASARAQNTARAPLAPHSSMGRRAHLAWAVCLLTAAAAVKVKVVMHSEQDDSKPEDEEPRTEPWEHRRHDATLLPFLKASSPAHKPRAAPADDKPDDDDKPATERARQQHPNEMIFPLIYKQSHINSMFKFGENWYTWSTEKRTDGSKATNYYICYDEPKRCDEIGWVTHTTL